MAIDSGRKGEFEARDEVRRLRNLIPQLMIASQRINQPGESGPYQDKTTYPKETEGQKLEKSGQYLKDPETEVDTSQPLESRMFDIDPKKHKTQQKQKKIRSIAEEGSTEGERQAGRGKLKDQTQLPKFFKAIIDAKPSPADLLKILQFLPALTGGGLGQMAGVNYGSPTERDLFLQRFQGPGGTLRNHPKEIRPLILKLGGTMKADASNNIRSLQSSGHQTVLDDNNPGRLKIIKQFKPPRA